MDYQKLFWEFEKKRRRLLFQTKKRIRRIYEEMARDLPQPLTNESPSLYGERFKKHYEKEQQQAGKKLEMVIASSVGLMASQVQKRERTYFDAVMEQAGKEKSKHRKTSPNIEKIINGKYYKDKHSLSDRIWNSNKEARQKIDEIIREGIRKGKSSYELAKDLEPFVNPEARKDWEWKKAYPNAGKKTIDYNAQRLARTAVMHAYQEQTKEEARENPFCKGIKWHSAFAHGRTCDLCKQRHGNIYQPDELPEDHPNGLCTMIPVMENLENVGKELGDWARGGYNPKLDRWFEKQTQDSQSDESDFGIGSIFSKKKIINEFKEKVNNIETEDIRKVFQESLKRTKIKASLKKISYHNQGTIILGRMADGSTLAHELFHEVDFYFGISKSKRLFGPIVKDFESLLLKTSQSGYGIEKYLKLKYPKAFLDIQDIEFKENYRGISDILNGITSGDINLGYGHKKEYWLKENALIKETWAQYGRMLYDNDDKVLTILEDIFPKTGAEVVTIIKEMK